jgi:hypothetical protein
MTDSDEEIFVLVRDEFADVRLGHPVELVTGRGRSLRRRRRAAPALAALVVAAAGVAVVANSDAPRQRGERPAAGADQRMRLAAWSVDPGDGGRVLLTVRDFKDPDQFTATLLKAGVRARVQLFPPKPPAGGYGCQENGQPGRPEINDVIIGRGRGRGSDDPNAEWFTIDPVAMPPDTYLDFVFIEGRAVLYSLVDGWPKDCVPVTDLPSGTTKISS